ncbi:hypothetical protein MCEMSEM18_03494 [Comamonadaceae bacterium]
MYTIKNSQIEIPCSTLVHAIARLNDTLTKRDLTKYRKDDPLRIESLDGQQWPVEFQSGGYMAYPLLHDGQSALQWLNRLLIEVRLHAISPTGAILSPQHMERSVWNGLQTLNELVKGYGNLFTDQQRKENLVVNGQVVNSLTQAFEITFRNYFGFGPTGPERSPLQAGYHEWYVAHALLRGEDIKQSTLDAYASVDWVQASYFRDVDWIEHLLQRPYLRGKFKEARHLSFVMSLEGKPDCSYKEVTTENVGYLASLLKALPADAGWLELDDLFYEKGILSVREPYETELPTLADGVPVNKLAVAIYEELIKKARKDHEASLEDRIKQGMTQREIAFTRQRIATMEREYSYSYPNKLANAVTQRNMHFLVDVLDSPNNVATQRAIKRVKGIEIERKASRERIREIFRLAGYEDDAQYQQARAEYDAQVAAAKAAKQAEDAIKRRKAERENLQSAMANQKIQFEGKVMSKAAFIESAIAQGFNRVTSEKRGAVPRYYLTNAAGSGYLLETKGGMLDYARMLLEQVESDQTTATL